MILDEDDAALTAAEIAVEALPPQGPPRGERAKALATHARALMWLQDVEPARSRAQQAKAAKAAKAPRVEADALVDAGPDQ